MFNRQITYWLLTGCFLIFSMVVIGGVTRLTGSGLSITEWNVIMGTLPPLDDQQWSEAFQKYQQIPQFREVNNHFSIEDFKNIFWWEYVHRLVGRLIGVVFLLPFLFFLLTRKLDGAMLRKALFLFALGGLQGFLGWFMVKSGLTERTSVSHIRLAIHLSTAFITFGFTFWFALQSMSKEPLKFASTRITLLYGLLLAFVMLQLVYGAFVAGLHAGQMFNTFPLMNGDVIPANSWLATFGFANLSDNPVTVQFIHRFLAFAVTFMVGWIFVASSKTEKTKGQTNAVRFLVAAVTVQLTLGILTILYQAPLLLSSLHQIGAFFLFSAVLLGLFRFGYRAAAAR